MLVIEFHLYQIILNYSASYFMGLADNNIIKLDVATIVRSGDAALNSH